MVEMTELLMERKADYSQVTEKSSRAIMKDPILNRKPLLNGDYEFFGRQYRSSSECSSDSNLDTLLEEADKIHSSKNGFRKNAPAKKQVRFNMERNREYFYSYGQPSDDESHHNLMSNVNFMDLNGVNSYDDDDDDDDDDDEDDDSDEDDDEDYSDQNGQESSEDDTRSDKYGYLVDKSNPTLEVNNNSSDSNTSLKSTKLNGTLDSVNDITDSVGEKILNGSLQHHHKQNGTLHEDKRLADLRSQVLQLESSLREKRESVEKEMSSLNTRLKKTREETKQEMDRLQEDLEDRKRHYVTEMEDIDRRREEQKKKFEEELEEFRNEKKLEERRQKYDEHEAIISQMEKDLSQRTQEVRERDKEVREYEEYLNRRHAVCNSKEEDLNILQNELDTLAKELETKKTKVLHKHQLLHQSSEEDMGVSTPPLRMRSASRASIYSSKGVDLRIEELKSQNRQLLEELFTLKKACESKDEELTELKEKLEVSESESKRLQQRTKHLETQLELARKSAELGADSISVDEIMRKTTQDMRNTRNSRVIRPSRAVAPCPSVASSQGGKLPRMASNDSIRTKNTSSTDSGKGTKESGMKSSKGSANKKNKDEGDGRHKLGTERITSSLCVVM